jgi:Na+/pantothenate symporter
LEDYMESKSGLVLGLWCYFSYIVAVSFIGGGNRSTR